MKFSLRVKEMRKRKGYTQKQMSKLLGISERHYQNYEYNNKCPKFDNLIKLANILDVSIDYLLGRTDNSNSHKL